MKKFQTICLWIVILFCIDYSITALLGFDLIYGRVKEMGIWHSLYAFVIGVSGFITILLLKKEE